MGDQGQANKVALITGGARGIGEGITRNFLSKGVGHVYFCDIRENDELTSKGGKFVKCDITNDEQVKACVDLIVKEQGRLDYLVNNAGWHPPHKPLDDFSLQDIRNLFELNTISMFAFIKLALPHIRAVAGSIVNVSSISSHLGQPGGAPYCATKGAIYSMTKALAVDEAMHGVRVNSVAPANTLTPLWTESVSNFPKEVGERLLRCGNEAQLIGRMNTVDEVAEGVWYLAAIATSTTGLELLITGGAELNVAKKTRIGASPYDPYLNDAK